MPTSFSKIARIKTVKIGFKKKSNDQAVISPEPSKSQPLMMPINPIVPKTTTTFFFNDQRCRNRALYITSKLKQTLNHPLRPRSSHGTLQTADDTMMIIPTPSLSTPTKKVVHTVDLFWRTVAHRLYTLNYILFILPSHSHARADFLNRIEAELSLKSDGQELQRRGGMESHFAVRYALEHKKRRHKTLLEDAFEEEKRKGGNTAGAILPGNNLRNDAFVEQARQVIEQCLVQESQHMTDHEKDSLYVDESRLAGLYDAFELRIELEEDRSLRHRLKWMVDQQKKANNHNPFEDQDLIVLDEEEESSRQQVYNNKEI